MISYLKILLLTLILIFGSFLFYSNVQAEDNAWPMFQHDIGHTGRSPFLGPGFSETLLVETLIEGEGDYFNTPVIDSSGILYLKARIESKYGVYAFYPDGTQKWYYPASLNPSSSVVLASNGDVLFYTYIENQEIALVMLDSEGTFKWEKILTDFYPIGYPVINNNIIYLFSYSSLTATSGLVSLNLETKEVDWTYEVEGYVRGFSPTIAQDNVIYFGQKDILYAINPDGTEKWTRKFISDCKYYTCYPEVLTPIIGDNNILYVLVRKESDWRALQGEGTFDHLHVIDLENPMMDKWETKFQAVFHPVLDSNGNVYVIFWRDGSSGGVLNLIGFNSQGDLIINEQLGRGNSKLMVVDSEDNIYVFRTYYSSTTLHIFNVNKPEKQKIVNSTFRYINDNPSLGNNRTLYVAAQEKLYAIGSAVEDINVAVILAEPSDVSYDSTPKTYQPCKLLPEKFYPNGRNKEYFQDLAYCVADYHKENSFERVNLNFAIYDNNGEWFKTSKPFKEIKEENKNREFFKDAIDLATSKGINLSNQDIILVVHAGERKAAYYLGFEGLDPLTGDGLIEGKVINSEYHSVGVWAHEIGHHIGTVTTTKNTITPDLYKMGNVEKWDIMAKGALNGGFFDIGYMLGNGTNPDYMSSYTKEFLGWLNYDIYPKSAYGEYWINSLETSEYGDTVFRYNLSDDTNDESQKYYILEVRNRNLKTWDSSLPEEKALVLYYVDSKGLAQYGYDLEKEKMIVEDWIVTIPNSGLAGINDGILNPLINETYRDLNNLVKFSAITDRSINDDYEIQTRIEEITYKSFGDKFWGIILKPRSTFKKWIEGVFNPSFANNPEIYKFEENFVGTQLAATYFNLKDKNSDIVPITFDIEDDWGYYIKLGLFGGIKGLSFNLLILLIFISLVLLFIEKKRIPRWKSERRRKIFKVVFRIIWIFTLIIFLVFITFSLITRYWESKKTSY